MQDLHRRNDLQNNQNKTHHHADFTPLAHKRKCSGQVPKFVELPHQNPTPPCKGLSRLSKSQKQTSFESPRNRDLKINSLAYEKRSASLKARNSNEGKNKIHLSLALKTHNKNPDIVPFRISNQSLASPRLGPPQPPEYPESTTVCL